MPASPQLKAGVTALIRRMTVRLSASLPRGPKESTGFTKQGMDLAVSGGHVSVVHVGKPVSTSGHSGWSSVTSVTQSTNCPRPWMFARNTGLEQGSSPKLLPTSENFANGELSMELGEGIKFVNNSVDMLDSTTTGLPDLDVSMVTSELSKIEQSDLLISLLQNCKAIKQRDWMFIQYSAGEIEKLGEKCIRNNLERDIKRLYLKTGSKLPSQKMLWNRATFDRLLVPGGGALPMQTS